MHFYSKSAAAAPLDHTFLYCADREAFELSDDDIVDQANMNAHRGNIEDNSPEASAVEPRRVPVAALGFYNLVKACAKDDPALGTKNLAAHVASMRRDIDGKNAKGSTGLHACGYLRRWDLAQVLLDAGADPLCKNIAGHSFFLTAVRDPGAPWEQLLALHPELHERHRSFLSKGSGHPRSGAGKRGERGEARPQSLDKAGLAPLPQVVNEKRRAAIVEPTLIAVLDAEDWSGVAKFLAEFPANLAGYTLPTDRSLNMAYNAPQLVLELLYTAALPFTPESSLAVVRRAIADGWAEGWWVKLGRGLPLGNQEELLNSALRDKRVDLILPMAKEGWRFGEDFIESCEEAGYLDMADDLIDLQASLKKSAPVDRPVGAGAPMGNNRKKRSGPEGLAPQSKKSNSKGGKGPRRVRSADGGARQSKQGSARRSAMIANLDGPVREANEFEYKDKKPSTSTTIIIVKKARVISLSEM